MRCPRCGNENSEENRFCGMCGGTLLPPAAPVGSAPQRSSTISSPASSVLQSPSTPTRTQIPAAPRTAAPVSDDAPRDVPQVPQNVPHISGPSFLGLSEPGPRKRGNLSIDPQSAPSSRNLDYLLEDDEGHKGGGAGKFILMLLALALAVGLGYLRWKNHGFPSLGSVASKPSAAAQNSDSPDAGSTTAPASSASPAPAASQPAGPPVSSSDTPTGGGAAGAGATTAAAPTSTTSATDPAAGTAPSTPPSTSPAASAGAPPSTSAPVAAAPSNDAANSEPDSASASPATATTVPTPAPESPTPTRSPAPAPKNPKPTSTIDRPAKPHAASLPVKPVDRVAEAQKYIYGRGVTQDCERGMRILKPAADQANPAAMVEMGALYSAGLCTPHDLPTAYRWFALALRKDPDNMAVQTDLQKLWGEMTQPERQLAIKMSQ